MRPSSLGGGRILRRTLSVCPSVCPSVPCAEVVYLADVWYLLLCLHLRAAYSRAISRTSLFVPRLQAIYRLQHDSKTAIKFREHQQRGKALGLNFRPTVIPFGLERPNMTHDNRRSGRCEVLHGADRPTQPTPHSRHHLSQSGYTLYRVLFD